MARIEHGFLQHDFLVLALTTRAPPDGPDEADEVGSAGFETRHFEGGDFWDEVVEVLGVRFFGAVCVGAERTAPAGEMGAWHDGGSVEAGGGGGG